MSKPVFSESLALNLSTPSSFHRGGEYFRDGGVEKIWREGEVYKALVRGTRLYEVSLRVTAEVDEGVKADCTCPYDFGGVCKHVVAAILALAADKSLAADHPPRQKEQPAQKVDKLVASASDTQRQVFLKRLLVKDPHLIEDLQIFLQGAKETPVTLAEYKSRFRERLEQIDLDFLLESWYAEGEDDYGNGYSSDRGGGVDSFDDEAEKYRENGNFTESLKINQAAFEALGEKRLSLKGEHTELEDLFAEAMDEALAGFQKALAAASDKTLLKIGFEYLGSLFEGDRFNLEPGEVGPVINSLAASQSRAQMAMTALSQTAGKKKLSVPESSLLAFLYRLSEDWAAFEKVSLDHLDQNPALVSDLLTYYQRKGQKEKVLETARKALSKLSRKDENSYPSGWYENEKLVTEIRRFLKKVYDPKTDRTEMVGNLENLFLITGSLPDYEALVKEYRTRAEKERFWEKMKKRLLKKGQVKPVFKVFRREDQKEEILNLVSSYPDEDFFPEMIASVQDKFPGKCSTAYQKKIEKMLEVPNTEVYPQAVYHLQRMQQIGLSREFNSFVGWIKTTYWRRRNLLRELKERGL